MAKLGVWAVLLGSLIVCYDGALTSASFAPPPLFTSLGGFAEVGL